MPGSLQKKLETLARQYILACQIGTPALLSDVELDGSPGTLRFLRQPTHAALNPHIDARQYHHSVYQPYR